MLGTVTDSFGCSPLANDCGLVVYGYKCGLDKLQYPGIPMYCDDPMEVINIVVYLLEQLSDTIHLLEVI